MVDIPVTFGTNASTVTPQIHGAAAATEKAAGATVKHTAAAKMADAEALKLAKSSALVTAATKAEASAHDANTAALHRATAAAREHAAAGDIAQHSMAEHTHAGWSQGARVGGFRHEMHAAEFAEGALTGGVGGLAVGGALAGALALEKLTEAIGKGIEVAEERVHADREYIEMLHKAKDAVGELALGAVKEFGGQLIDLTSRGRGLKEMAEELAKDGAAGGLGASQRAVMLASRLYPGHEQQALKQANDAGSLTGESIDKLMERLEGMPLSTILNGNAAGKALVEQHRGQKMSDEEYDNSAGRTSNSSQAMAIRTVQSINNRGDISNVEKIAGDAVTAAREKLQQTIDPISQAIQENNKKLQETLEDAHKTRESLTTLQTALDNLRFSLNHIGMGEKSTLTKIDEAGAKLHDNATRPNLVPSSWGPLPAATPHP